MPKSNKLLRGMEQGATPLLSKRVLDEVSSEPQIRYISTSS
jgi:hypothetical protein